MGVKNYSPDELSQTGGNAAGGESAPAQPGLAERYGMPLARGAADLAGGVGAGALHTLSTLGRPVGYLAEKLGAPKADPNSPLFNAPDSAMGAIGKGAEQAGEFLLPGLGEEKVVGLLPEAAEGASLARRLLAPAARVAYQAGTSGAVNAAQGGGFGTGVGAGLLGGATGEGLRAAAPGLMETGLRIGKAARGFGRGGGNIGRAVLENTSGGLAGIEETGGDAIRTLSERYGQMADRASALPAPSNLTLDMGRVRGVFDPYLARAGAEEAATRRQQLGGMRSFFERGRVSGEPIPEVVTPRRGLDLQRGFSDEELNWNPELRDQAQAAGREAYHALGQELDRALPEGAGMRGTVSRLMPAVKQAGSLQRNADVGQRVLGRIGAHSGALLGGVAGGTAGFERGGVPGLIGGGLTGLVLPELLASPQAQVRAARLLYRAAPRLMPAAAGGLLQMDRPQQ